jgi:hypothetical protein
MLVTGTLNKIQYIKELKVFPINSTHTLEINTVIIYNRA